MASVDEIAIKLGIKTGDLKAALASAGADIKKFKVAGETGANEGFVGSLKKMTQGVNLFKNLLLGGGIIGAFRAVFNAAVKYAENYTGTLDRSVSATLRMRDKLSELGDTLGRWAVTVIGAVENVGLAAGALVYGTEAAADALNAMDAEAKKAFDDIWVKKLTEATAKLTTVRRDAALEAASDNEKINLLAGEYVRLLEEQAKLTEGSLLWIQKTIAVETAAAALRKQDRDTRKKEETDAQKAAADAQKALEAHRSKLTLGLKEDLELFALQAKASGTLTAAEAKRLAGLLEQKRAKEDQLEIEALHAKFLTGTLTPEEAARLAELLKQQKAIEAQTGALKGVKVATDEVITVEEKRSASLDGHAIILAGQNGQLTKAAELAKLRLLAEENVTDEVRRRIKELEAELTIYGQITRTGKTYDSQSRVSLEGVLSRLMSQITVMERDNSFRTTFSPEGKNPLLYALQAELFAVQKELSQRRAVQDTVSRLGEDAARRQFGDTLTDNALREIQDAGTRTAVALEDLRARVAASPFFDRK